MAMLPFCCCAAWRWPCCHPAAPSTRPASLMSPHRQSRPLGPVWSFSSPAATHTPAPRARCCYGSAVVSLLERPCRSSLVPRHADAGLPRRRHAAAPAPAALLLLWCLSGVSCRSYRAGSCTRPGRRALGRALVYRRAAAGVCRARPLDRGVLARLPLARHPDRCPIPPTDAGGRGDGAACAARSRPRSRAHAQARMAHAHPR